MRQGSTAYQSLTSLPFFVVFENVVDTVFMFEVSSPSKHSLSTKHRNKICKTMRTRSHVTVWSLTSETEVFQIIVFQINYKMKYTLSSWPHHEERTKQ